MGLFDDRSTNHSPTDGTLGKGRGDQLRECRSSKIRNGQFAGRCCLNTHSERQDGDQAKSIAALWRILSECSKDSTHYHEYGFPGRRSEEVPSPVIRSPDVDPPPDDSPDCEADQGYGLCRNQKARSACKSHPKKYEIARLVRDEDMAQDQIAEHVNET